MHFNIFKDYLLNQDTFYFSSDDFKLPIPEELKLNHIIFETSGTLKKKRVFIAKDAFLRACSYSIKEFGISKDDVYGYCLPHNYIAKALIYGRGIISGCQIKGFEESWNPISFYDFLKQNSVTLLSLVPTQLFDIFQLELRPVKSLRLVFVSGGRVSSNLLAKAKNLRWPIVVTFGATETCGMFAKLQGNIFKVFTDAVVFSRNKKLCIKSLTCASAILEGDKLSITNNLVCLADIVKVITPKSFKFYTREHSSVKVKGFIVNLEEIKKFLLEFGISSSVKAMKDERVDNQISIYVRNLECKELTERVVASRFPFLKGCINVLVEGFIK